MFWKFYCMHYTIGKNKTKYILSKVYQILLKLPWFKRFRFTIINIIYYRIALLIYNSASGDITLSAFS